MTRRSMRMPCPAWIVCALAAAVLALAASAPAHAGCSIRVDAREARELADRVWRNESGGDLDKILWWNPGEAFASAGIGHFIWYPAGADVRFRESFPELLAFLASRGVPLPDWLAHDATRDCPWPTREAFIAQSQGPMATDLRRLLAGTFAQQTEFMLARLESALASMLAGVSEDRARTLESRFCALAATPSGRYALLDYVNFKGEGSDPRERYQGEGWGVEQVLEEMHGSLPVNEDFAAAAGRVLERRVRNAPPDRGESRWLTGWLSRVQSYTEPP